MNEGFSSTAMIDDNFFLWSSLFPTLSPISFSCRRCCNLCEPLPVASVNLKPVSSPEEMRHRQNTRISLVITEDEKGKKKTMNNYAINPLVTLLRKRVGKEQTQTEIRRLYQGSLKTPLANKFLLLAMGFLLYPFKRLRLCLRSRYLVDCDGCSHLA